MEKEKKNALGNRWAGRRLKPTISKKISSFSRSSGLSYLDLIRSEFLSFGLPAMKCWDSVDCAVWMRDGGDKKLRSLFPPRAQDRAVRKWFVSNLQLFEVIVISIR